MDDSDPAAAGARVRRDLAALGGPAGPASADDVPPHVTARVVAALQAQTENARPRRGRRWRAGLLLGAAALVAAAGVGVAGRPAPGR